MSKSISPVASLRPTLSLSLNLDSAALLSPLTYWTWPYLHNFSVYIFNIAPTPTYGTPSRHGNIYLGPAKVVGVGVRHKAQGWKLHQDNNTIRLPEYTLLWPKPLGDLPVINDLWLSLRPLTCIRLSFLIWAFDRRLGHFPSEPPQSRYQTIACPGTAAFVVLFYLFFIFFYFLIFLVFFFVSVTYCRFTT